MLASATRVSIGICAGVVVAFGAQPAAASLLLSNLYSGNVGLSVDGAGSNNPATGTLQAELPTTATVLQAYLYAAGVPFPFYSDAPTSLADYNASGITLNGTTVSNFDHLVGAVSTPRPDIGAWFTGRADVTSIVNAYRTANPALSTLARDYTDGTKTTRLDGGVLVVVYEDASVPSGSVVILDGGQDTGGETSTVHFASPLSDPSAAGFLANMSLAISFSCCDQVSNVDINGTRLTSSAGDLNDGASSTDGSLITAGGVGDSNANPADPNSTSPSGDDELYDLRPFLQTGDTSFSLFTNNPTADDNIFFLGLNITADISDVVTPGTPAPEPASLALFGLGLAGLGLMRRRRAA